MALRVPLLIPVFRLPTPRLQYNQAVSPLRKRLAVVLAVGLLGAAAAFVYLRLHALEMIHAVVLNAVIQRLPDGYPLERVQEAFQARLQAADTPEERDLYLEQLKELSLQIEKVQYLDAGEVDDILSRIRPADSVLR